MTKYELEKMVKRSNKKRFRQIKKWCASINSKKRIRILIALVNDMQEIRVITQSKLFQTVTCKTS